MAKTDAKKDGAKKRVIDFDESTDMPAFKTSGKEKSLSPKQIRARARRHGKIAAKEFEQLYKPIEEWSAEELARGRPKDKGGKFRGRPPAWITRKLHEEIAQRFQAIVREGMNERTVDALKVIEEILKNDDVDDRNKPVVPASTKLDAAKFLIEHVVGKPTQRTETDISVRLQAVLASATIMPGHDSTPDIPGLYSGVIDADSWEEADVD